VTGFTLAGHTWAIEYGDSTGRVTGVRRDGAPLTLAVLPTARMPMSDGPWTTGTMAFARLQGTPRAGVAPGVRARLLSTRMRGWDASATPAPANDLTAEATLAVGGEGGLAVRASAGSHGLRGALLTFLPAPDGDATKVRVALVTIDDSGQESFVTAPQAL